MKMCSLHYTRASLGRSGPTGPLTTDHLTTSATTRPRTVAVFLAPGLTGGVRLVSLANRRLPTAKPHNPTFLGCLRRKLITSSATGGVPVGRARLVVRVAG